MEPIKVSRPPASSFNKNRAISDLLQAQLKHFQHLEQKHGAKIDPGIARDIHTEAGAARYIAEVTGAILRRADRAVTAVPAAAPIPLAKTPETQAQERADFSTAAVAKPTVMRSTAEKPQRRKPRKREKE